MTEHGETAKLFVALGGTFLAGLAADVIGRRTRLPRVTLLIVIGFLAGPVCLDVLPEESEVLFPIAANLALTMVGFLLGERLGHAMRGADRAPVLYVSMGAVLVTALVVFAGLLAMGVGVEVALLLAGIATATAPAATVDVVREHGRAGRFGDMLLAVVAVDDAWGLLVFSFALAGAGMVAGDAVGAGEVVTGALVELGGSVLLGGGLGLVMAFLTGRLAKGEPTVLEAIGMMLLVSGLAQWLDLSFILAAMVMGVVVSALAKHHERPFHVIENLELPFMIVFFVLAGASLELGALASLGWIGVAYVALRAIGRVAGGWIGAVLGGESGASRRWIGAALMPQAGVALGMALVAAERLPEIGERVLQVTIGATVFFELTGPLLTRLAITRVNAANPK